MKSQKLIGIALTGCVLMGASGAAIAENTCESGYITGVIDDDIVISGPLAGCDIQNATVNGNVIAKGANLSMNFVDVNGKVRAVDGDTAVIIGSTANSMRLARNNVAIMFGNLVNDTIVVNRNQVARVKQNGAVKAITCENNDNLEASYNTVGPLGVDNCHPLGN